MTYIQMIKVASLIEEVGFPHQGKNTTKFVDTKAVIRSRKLISSVYTSSVYTYSYIYLQGVLNKNLFFSERMSFRCVKSLHYIEITSAVSWLACSPRVREMIASITCSSLLMMEKCLSTQTHNPDYEAISMCSSLLMTCASWRSSKCIFLYIYKVFLIKTFFFQNECRSDV
jgi:hypothetical protein